MDAILDFSARHQLCQFMPAVSETTDYAEHFGIWHVLFYGGGGSRLPLEIVAFSAHSHPTNIYCMCKIDLYENAWNCIIYPTGLSGLMSASRIIDAGCLS